jgi:hypothetical protein
MFATIHPVLLLYYCRRTRLAVLHGLAIKNAIYDSIAVKRLKPLDTKFLSYGLQIGNLLAPQLFYMIHK